MKPILLVAAIAIVFAGLIRLVRGSFDLLLDGDYIGALCVGSFCLAVMFITTGMLVMMRIERLLALFP